MYGNAAAKNITELLETDSQSADRHHNRSNPITSLQRLLLHGDNKKIFILMLLWKTCHSIHPSFFCCMSACLALRVSEGAVALPRYLGVKAGNILDKASSRQTTNCAYINFCGYLGRTHADTERVCCAQERSQVRIKPATFLLWDNSVNQCTIKVIHTDFAQIRLISVLH